MTDSRLPCSAATEDAWLLVKRGLFYRPNNSGYTGIRDEAGRYSRQDADEHMAAGGKAMREADAPEFMPGAYSDIVIKRLTEQRDEARVELARIRGDAQPALETAPLRLCGYCKSWNSKPCGEGCCWSQTDPTIEKVRADDLKAKQKHNRKHPLPVTFER
jgi:hypothetical protein